MKATREPDPLEQPPPQRRPTTALSFLRAATPSLGRKLSAAFRRPATALGSGRRGDDDDDDDGGGAGKRGPVASLLGGLLSRKRKRVSPSPPPMPPLRIMLNFLFVGSQGCGQTSLLLLTSAGRYPSRARYGHFPDRLSYIKWDAVFLCFDVMDKVSMFTIMQWLKRTGVAQWNHARDGGFTTNQPVEPLLHLVGLKKDLRDTCMAENHRDGQPALMSFPTCCVSPADGYWHTQRIRGDRYLECSALTGEGMEVLFEHIGREATWRAVRAQESKGRMAPSRMRL
ncbi:hypothetical protein S40285_01766, partial [Stachybotrys chlorohalonatus IBT 40285]